MTQEKLYKVTDLKPFTGLANDTNRRLVREGKIKAFKPGGRMWFVKESDLRVSAKIV